MPRNLVYAIELVVVYRSLAIWHFPGCAQFWYHLAEKSRSEQHPRRGERTGN
jgi:hypothetical protein